MDDLAAFARLVEALKPWRTQLVIVGGWAHRLYRFHPRATAQGYQALTTRDTDLAFANDAPLGGNIKSALSAAGFEEELYGDHRPPVTHYALGDDDAGFYAEFLTPLLGSSVKRSGEPDATVSTAGITAQKLRHLGVLLVRPWQITIGREQGVPLDNPARLLVANPVSFIVQKLLIQKDRTPTKRAQDVLYSHDTLQLVGTGRAELKTLWNDEIRPALPAKTGNRVIDLAGEAFSSVSDVIRDAARIPQDRAVSPEQLQASCQLAISHVLST